ncbi:caffeic acid 3-O-methyltransferase 1-like [Cryptomeria japonica]|uniref:caffeic acid 3-O-methyltransferase 1-like n=1 Tax=Cryptomeria japonica TaxID=3369 RepID=UPI0027DA9D02|nr:caffeic acid 3-O-methyltransferase 1-like [Cryptomeria japonica]
MASLESSMEAHLQLYEIFLTAAKPMALQAAVLLNIPDIIGSQNQLSVEEIASHISASTNKPVHIDYLSRIMRLLASIGVFTEETTADNRAFKYGPTGLSKLLANNEPQESSAPTLLFLNQNIMTQGYQYLHDTVIDGCQAFSKANGMSIFEYNSKNSEANRMFNDAMTAQTSSVMASVCKVYDGFKSFKSVVDVAGGVGSALSTIVKEYPHIHGINFDLPHVVRTAPPTKGVEHVEGNMFEEIPSADSIFIKTVLHNWDDEHCLKILKKSYDAVTEDGKVLIVDAVIDKTKRSKSQVGLLSDILMMAVSTDGKERTEDEFKNLFYKAGFKGYSIIELPFYLSLIEVSK